jgi:hypothetical protein
MAEEIVSNILLVEPNFPIPAKSKNHSNFLPIGLLKLASYHRNKGHNIRLLRGNEIIDFQPHKILITSLFTYWSKYVKESVQFYKNQFPNAEITVGGIYATLMPRHCKEYTTCDNVFIGQNEEADKCVPAYDLVDVDFQIIHGMRGCSRKCNFCGIWRLENLEFKNAMQIKEEIQSNKLIFYDNNMLVNPHIEEILEMLAHSTYNGKVIKCECQSGFDGRILEENPHFAKLLKNARFENIRVAWDFSYDQYPRVENWIQILVNAGFSRNRIFVFMIYNWKYDFNYIEMKRMKCFEMGVQISDCRYRPLDSTFDNYRASIKDQTSEDYFISPEWSDSEIKQFRRNVREHNICIRHRLKWGEYSREFETRSRRKTSPIKILV